jgi:hypothetical protein
MEEDMKVICKNANGAALTLFEEYEAKPAVNRDYYRIIDDEGNLNSFRTFRFTPVPIMKN